MEFQLFYDILVYNMRKSRIDYEKVERHHMAALREAFNNASEEMKNEMLYFKAIHKWVDDYAFFMAYRDYNSKNLFGKWMRN